MIDTRYNNQTMQSRTMTQDHNEASDILKKLNKLRDRQQETYTKIQENIEQTMQEIIEAERQIQASQDPSIHVQQMLKNLSEKKPYNHIKNEFRNFYKKLSTFTKGLNHVETENSTQEIFRKKGMEKPIIDGEQIELLYAALNEHYLREGAWKSARIFKQQNSQEDIFIECAELKGQISKGEYKGAIAWAETERLYETYNDMLEYELKKQYILEIVRRQEFSKALEFYSLFMPKFFQKKEVEINKLVGFMLFNANTAWKKELVMLDEKEEENSKAKLSEIVNQRYREFKKEVNKEILANEFERKYLKHYNLSQFDSIKICFQAGVKHESAFMKSFTRLPDEQLNSNILPFEIATQSKHKYHSLFFCPVTRQVSSSKEGAVLLECGHLISEIASTRLVETRGRKRIRCPVCTKEQKADSMVQVYF